MKIFQRKKKFLVGGLNYIGDAAGQQVGKTTGEKLSLPKTNNATNYAAIGTIGANVIGASAQQSGGKTIQPSVSQQAVGATGPWGQLMQAGSQMTQSIAENKVGRDQFGISKNQSEQGWLSGVGASTDPLGGVFDSNTNLEQKATSLFLPFKYGYDKSNKENSEAIKAKNLYISNLTKERNLEATNAEKLNQMNAFSSGFKSSGNINEFDKGGKIQKGKPLNILSKPILLPNQIPIRNPRPALALNGEEVGKENEKNITLRPTQYLDGGKLKQLSSDTQLAEGNTHEQGGIDLTENSEIENQETVKDKGDSYMIMSNNLINPKSGNTFAKDDLKLAKQAGKLEGSKKTSSINGLKLINRKRELLENMQQIMNGNSQGQNI